MGRAREGIVAAMIKLSTSRFGSGWGLADKLPVVWQTAMKFYNDIPRKMAEAFAGEMKKAIRATDLAPNSGATVILKGSGVPLVHTGKMKKSIITKNMGTFDYYGGIDPAATTPDGTLISKIAQMQNAGYVIPVTAKIRALMDSHGIIVSPDTKFFVVPARPFLARALDKVQPRFKKIQKEAGIGAVRIMRSA